MPSRKKGSAAVAMKAMPESADVLSRRAALRQQLPDRLDRLQRVLDLARQALAGPDPEASLGYLRRLSHHTRLARSQFE